MEGDEATRCERVPSFGFLGFKDELKNQCQNNITLIFCTHILNKSIIIYEKN